MRKVIYAINVTLDGCFDHDKQPVDDEKMDFFTRLTRESDLFVYGRKTYELMVPYWPDVAKNPSEGKSDRDFALAFEAARKVVFSRSLKSVDDKKTTVLRTDLREEILKLKKEPGKNILAGGVDVPSQMIKLGLIDEYLFVISPVIAGKGRRLMEGVNLPEALQLKLLDTKTFKSGSVALRYVKQQ
jgi:dihydrofolate reductase